MKSGINIKDRYKPFNFSTYKCHVIEMEISQGVNKIEAILPAAIKIIRGIYVTNNFKSDTIHWIGIISLFFDEGAIKNLQMPVINSKRIRHNSHPIPMYQEIKKGSTLEGYYLDVANYDFTYSLKIYIHYEE
jgi:hypothetical protein